MNRYFRVTLFVRFLSADFADDISTIIRLGGTGVYVNEVALDHVRLSGPAPEVAALLMAASRGPKGMIGLDELHYALIDIIRQATVESTN